MIIHAQNISSRKQNKQVTVVASGEKWVVGE